MPYVPGRDELPEESADFLLRFLDQFMAEERDRGALLARQALERFAGPVDGIQERHELVVLIGWLVRAAMGAPPWRWLGLN